MSGGSVAERAIAFLRRNHDYVRREDTIGDWWMNHQIAAALGVDKNRLRDALTAWWKKNGENEGPLNMARDEHGTAWAWNPSFLPGDAPEARP